MRKTAQATIQPFCVRLSVLICAVLLSACAPATTKSDDDAPAAEPAFERAPPMSTPTPAATREACDASKAQSFIGQPASSDVQAQARSAAGAAAVRTLRPGQPITREFNGGRLNLHVDQAGNIVSINCG